MVGDLGEGHWKYGILVRLAVGYFAAGWDWKAMGRASIQWAERRECCSNGCGCVGSETQKWPFAQSMLWASWCYRERGNLAVDGWSKRGKTAKPTVTVFLEYTSIESICDGAGHTG